MSFTRLQLKNRAKARADQVELDSTWDTYYNDWLDEGARQAWLDLIQAGMPVDYTTEAITATGAVSYAFAAGLDIVGVHGVYYKQGADFFQLRRVNQGKYAQLRSASVVSGFAEMYEVRRSATGHVLELLPHPSGGAYSIDYVPNHPGFPNDASLWVGPPSSEQLIVLSVAAKGLHKEGSIADSQDLEREYMVLLEKVASQASFFDLRNPQQIRDVTSQDTRFAFDYQVAGPGLDG